MTFRNTLKNAFLPVAMAMTGLIAGSAHALEMGSNGCLPPAALMAQLAAEGQASIVVADRVIPATTTSPAKSVFVVSTALKSGKVGKGYSFEGDQPTGTPSTQFCLSGEYNNARALNVAVAEVPYGIAENSNLAKAINYSIKKDGYNPMFYGEKNGAITVIVGNPDKKSQLNGMILLGNNDPTRQAGDQGGLIGLDYSPNYDRSVAISEPK